MKKCASLFLLVIFIVSFSLTSSGEAYGANYWKTFNEAQTSMDSRDYSTAINKFNSIIPDFEKINDDVNLALIYGKLGKCCAETKDYDNAVLNWRKEAVYWSKLGKNQDSIAANRKADFFDTQIRVFAELDSAVAGKQYYHGAKYEPEMGIYLGAYAENDPLSSNYGNNTNHYFNEFPQWTGKEHAAYLLYMSYGSSFNSYMSHFDIAKSKDIAVQIAWQPTDISNVKDDTYLRQFARDAAKANFPIFLRFANEMNDPTSGWYVDPELYKEKFGIVARVFHQEAPNVVMVWAPNYFPPDNIQNYYPGDEYVDWVGVSLYKEYLPELDPLQENIDRENYLANLANIYNLYSDRKPIFISESGVTYTNQKNGANITPWASYQMKQIYAYLPMLYPKVKAIYWFDSNHNIPEAGIYRSYLLSANNSILNSYKDCISSDFYLSKTGQKSAISYGDIERLGLAPRINKISAYIKAADPYIANVVYKISGETIASSSQIPFTIEYDFNKFAGQDIAITVEAYGKNSSLISSRDIHAYVGNANVKFEGKNIDLNSQTKIINGSTFLPVRSLVESAGGTISWDDASKSFEIVKGENSLKLAINSTKAIKNGTEMSINTAPFIYNNRSYLPLRFIAEELLDLKVDWNPDSKTVILEQIK